MRYTSVQTPKGVRDILPREATRKYSLEKRAAAFLESWGYERIMTPTFEYYDALAHGDQSDLGDELYRFVDRDGSALALRSEMTTPIARAVATRFKPEDIPIRLHYVGNVFRYDEPQAGRHREFTQIGAELIGYAGPRADAEMITLALGLLKELGLRSFRIDLGHVGFFLSLVQGENGTLMNTLRDALLTRDFVRYEQIIDGSDLESSRKHALSRLPVLRGYSDVHAVLQEARQSVADIPGALGALDELEAVVQLVEAYGFGSFIGIDLGMMKDLDYYSGLLMEGYVPQLGFTLCTGGRYDHLIGRYGWDVPATGFALGADRALLALDRQGHVEQENRRKSVFLFADAGDEEALFEAAGILRSHQVDVEVDVGGRGPGELRGEGEEDGERVAAKVSRAGDTLVFDVPVKGHGAGASRLTLEQLIARWEQSACQD